VKGAYGDLRIPRSNNNLESFNDFQVQFSSFCKIHSAVLCSRPSPNRLWWLVHGTVDIHSKVSVS